MATLLERLAETRDALREAEHDFEQAIRAARGNPEQDFVDAVRAARAFHSWAEIAAVAGLSPSGVRYVVGQDGHKKGETDGTD